MRSVKPLAFTLRGTPNSVFGRPVTAGCSKRKLNGLRETSGRFATELEVSVLPWPVRPTSTIGASDATVTSAVTPGSWRAMSMVAEMPAFELDAGLAEGREAGRGDLEVVLAEGQCREAILAGGGRGRRLHVACAGVGRLHLGFRDGCAAWVGDGAGDFAVDGGGLAEQCGRGACRDDKAQEYG